MDHRLIRFDRKNSSLAEAYEELCENEKRVLDFFRKAGRPCTVKELHEAFADITLYRLRPVIYALTMKSFIRQVGRGPKTKFEITEDCLSILDD